MNAAFALAEETTKVEIQVVSGIFATHPLIMKWIDELKPEDKPDVKRHYLPNGKVAVTLSTRWLIAVGTGGDYNEAASLAYEAYTEALRKSVRIVEGE